MRSFHVFAIGLVFLAACAPSSLGVSQILTSDRVNIRQEIETSRDVLSPESRTFYAHAFVTGLRESTPVTGTWWYGDPGVRIYETTVTVTPEAPVAKFFLSNAADWREGEYRLVLRAGDREIGSATIRVGNNSSPDV